ncbi:ABC transporter permease [Gordoniibacillus kamchatkensis]|uniref:ABC transporter permease n=2 Tax=Gordoniibacillus kamchatkensis TaxID=1590651 RepID=A0ABR5ACR8_9BACL|nr:ABC transporter permease [Paenibacillus sp. VKM B-2647]
MLLPLLIVMVAILAYPLLYSFWISFRNIEITKPHQNQFVGLVQYAKVWQDPAYWNVLKNTFGFVCMAVSMELVLGMILALCLKNMKRYRNVTRAILLTPMFITPIAVGLMFRYLLSTQLGLVPALLHLFGISIDFFSANMALFSLSMIDVWQWTPFMLLMLLAGLENLPEEPYEAARVDGAGSWYILTRITIPLMSPVMIVAVLIRALDAMKVFEYVYAITRGGPGTATETLQYYVYKTGFGYYNLSKASAVAWTVVIFVMIVLILILWRSTRGEQR